MQNKKAYLWGGITRIAPAAIQLGTSMILARFLSPDDFGTIGVLSIIFMVAGVLVDSGLGGSLIKEKQISTTDCNTIATFNLGVSIIVFLTIFLFSGIIESFFGIRSLSKIVILLSLTFVINAFGLVPKSLLARDLKFKQLCNITIAGVVISSLVSVIMAICNFGVYSLVAYQLANCIFSTLLAIFASKYNFRFEFSKDSFKRLIPFGVYTSITTIIDSFYENLLTTLTGKYLNITQAGYLSQSKKIQEGLTISVASTISNVVFPILSKLKENKNDFVKEANSITQTICLITFPLLLSISLFSKPIIVFLFGKTWAPASIYLSALNWAGLFLIIETLIRSYIKSLCEVKALMNATIIKRILGIALIIASLIVNQNWLIYGYIVSTFVGLLVNLITYGYLIEINIMKLLYDTLKPAVPSILLYVVVYAFNIYSENDMLTFGILIIVLIVYYSIYMHMHNINLFKMMKK